MGVKLLGKIKIHEIAKKVGLTSKEVIEKAKELGIAVTSHLSTVEDEQAVRLEQALSNDKIKNVGKKEKKVKEKEIETPDNFSALSKEYLESLNLKTGKIVATNEECGKVINNFVCYIATITSSEEAKQAKVGDEIKDFY